jgi:hypothetical protein
MVTLKNIEDLEDLVIAEFAARQRSGDQIRHARLSATEVLTLILFPSGKLEVHVYPNLAVVWGARLGLVSPVSRLHYTPELELMPHVKQVLEGNQMITHCFHVDREGVHGLMTRGASFQKFETYIRAKLSDTQDLFSSLKRLERHFIKPQSDPYYQEMVARLERATRLLDSRRPGDLEAAESALNKGRLCLKSTFPNDRLLTLLVTHLEHGIHQRRTQRQPEPNPAQ